MGLRFANPLRSEFHENEVDNMRTIKESDKSPNLFVKYYPKFFRREDIHGDFVAVKRELKISMPNVRILKEDVDSNCARLQFDASLTEQNQLERILVKRGFVSADRVR